VDVSMDFLRKLRRFRFSLMMYLIFYLLKPVSLSVIILHSFFIRVEPVKERKMYIVSGSSRLC